MSTTIWNGKFLFGRMAVVKENETTIVAAYVDDMYPEISLTVAFPLDASVTVDRNTDHIIARMKELIGELEVIHATSAHEKQTKH